MMATRANLHHLALAGVSLFVLSQIAFAQKILENLSCDFSDGTLCEWSFSNEEPHFESIFNHTNYHTSSDYDNEQDQVLLLRPTEKHKKDQFVTYSLKSPTFFSGDYELVFRVNMNFMGNIFVIVIQDGSTESQILKVTGNRQQKWETYSIKLHKYMNISVALEINFDPEQINFETDYVGLNYVNIIDKRTSIEKCEYKCDSSERCLANDNLCDTVRDCPRGDDENKKCDKLPPGSYCDFRYNFCHWFNYDNSNSSGQWIHVQSSPSEGYLGMAFKGHKFGAISYLKSVIFEPIPLYHSIVTSKYYKTCKARFSYKFSSPSSDLSLDLEPQVENERWKAIQVWRKFNKYKSDNWTIVSIPLPVNMHHKYRLKFGAALGLKSFSAIKQKISVAIDNFSLSKECFAIDVPDNEPRVPAFIPSIIKGIPFTIPKNKSIKSYTFTSCGAKGRTGPTYSQCELFYMNSTTRAALFENENITLHGSQMWTVPKSSFYTIFARGADGGSGLYNHSGGRGSLVRASFWFQEGDTIFVSIGQSGASACSEVTRDFEACKNAKNSNFALDPNKSNMKSNMDVGGGGGGATYVFRFKPYLTEKWVPLLIAGGGGGGSGKMNPDFKYTKNQHGKGFDLYNIGTVGNGEGAGGGWNISKSSFHHVSTSNQTGKSLLFGAEGGLPCKRMAKWQTNGGFGGGGGGCSTGGGGGGFHGGNTNKMSEAGDGGTSFVDFTQSYLQLFSEFDNSLPSDQDQHEGLVVIIPQQDHCCNDGRFSCLITGEAMNGTLMKQCICGHDRFMADMCIYERPFYLTLLWITLCILILLFLLFFATFLFIQKRSGKHKQLHRNESNDLHLLSNSSTDVQLSRLRSHNIGVTEYNPNYEFGGSTCTLQDLKEIPREKLNLVKALGQGAFGEVYQGYLHNMPGEVTDELPVAVKTLPEYSANKQAEMDFLMEALIMSKFKHKNIVRFLGICFEKMPRFIVLELLPGGDLKTFLRENRSTIDSPSSLVMGDLLVMALDVACGCQYLEENHFIHRDIAARNCLLTSKVKMPSSLSGNSSQTCNGTFDINNYKNGFNNSGIVVKIADFGMARDIYRADYYRKGGKAMLPVKWMPPEAFLDGVFTSKTDVWSWGIMLWEVFSMGYMPYPGRGNQEVMQLVTAGGRLEPPNSSTPPQVYAIMTQCWNATPEFRPNFSTIIERIGYCLQDPDVLNVCLPVFHRSASVEKDMTLMRPPPDATDYLVPNNPGSQTNSNYSMATEKTELLSPDTCSTLSCANDDKLLEIEDQMHMQDRNNMTKLWNEDMLAQQMMPFNMNPMNSYPSKQQSFNSGIVLNPTNLNYSQQPCVRYVNVNVNNEMFNHAMDPNHAANLASSHQSNETNNNKAPVNC